ncbi:hypothetical protein Bca52824_013945 [Brassica carinata]|uniref:Uncharacterized protein n=1 Tax=Brassica carinata TaxID=52824 RepID=A0A8X7W0M9_BRACI|nr:hypothetical protein Bca52824_013945 [Brassica carinata]
MITGVVWQGFFLGAIGVVFCESSLASGVLISVLLSLTEVLAVGLFPRDVSGGERCLSFSLYGDLFLTSTASINPASKFSINSASGDRTASSSS